MATGSRRRKAPRWPLAALGTALGAAITLGGLMSIALAINPTTPFEIDGNADDDLGGGTDWQSELPLNGPGETFIVDQVPPLATETFFHGGGSKDDNQPSKWGLSSGTATNPNKNNITNAYAKAIGVTFPANDMVGHPGVPHEHLVIYFGADRFDNEGDAALGFWFFENEITPSGNGFTGSHTDNDLLVQVDYLNGGARAEIQVFKWQGDATGTHGTPKVLKEIAFGAADGATVCTPGNIACATTNESPITAYWPYTPADPSPPNTLPERSFFEGGVDITALLGQVCFSTFMATSRSSHSETAQLKDFALGSFDLCSVKLNDKTCDVVADQSPTYDYSTDLFQTHHTITIENNGFGPVYDIQIQDNAVNAASTCDIVQIGGVNVANIPIPNSTTWIDVADSLGPGMQTTVGLLCQSELNPFVNQATVRASATDGGPPLTADADDTVTESGADVTACELTLSPMLDVTKSCKSVSLDPTTFKPQVGVDISITNKVASQQIIDINTFNNTEFDQDGPGPFMPEQHNLLAAFQAANGGSLAMSPTGVPVEFSVCYEPDAPDGYETNPGNVMYSDTIYAEGVGRAGDADASDMASASCKLCPTCPTCE